ncbi:hypothetical protein NUW54_g7414 [Trametes sanguinea]|uniref:Uncharacterized protein n=1 Tax=Trametes sanguinea TaxID=158606 RepID=A0ACC1PNB1_9APHY|nr:hypothetical protein NUW54_g7414 [Trametes sanguinea]
MAAAAASLPSFGNERAENDGRSVGSTHVSLAYFAYAAPRRTTVAKAGPSLYVYLISHRWRLSLLPGGHIWAPAAAVGSRWVPHRRVRRATECEDERRRGLAYSATISNNAIVQQHPWTLDTTRKSQNERGKKKEDEAGEKKGRETTVLAIPWSARAQRQLEGRRTAVATAAVATATFSSSPSCFSFEAPSMTPVPLSMFQFLVRPTHPQHSFPTARLYR